MITANVQAVAEEVTRRARQQGFVLSREVREELAKAGLPDSLWKSVLALVKPALTYRGGRYWYPAPARLGRDHKEEIRESVRAIIRAHQEAAAKVERRGEDRLDFIETVQVSAEDGRSFTLLSRDLSSTGIRLVGTQRLLGQKVRVSIPPADGGQPSHFLVRILWTCAVGDDLFENGGAFLEVER
jgi:PilZ domain